MSESYLTLKQLVELVDIPENSLKRYMLEHEEFVRFDKAHNRYRIHVSSVETLKTIRKLYGEGYKREAVDEYLRGSGVPVTITIDSEDDARKPLININEDVAELKNMFSLQNQLLQQVLMKQDAAEKERTERERVLLQKIEEAEKKAEEIERQRMERERLLLQEIQESKQLHQKEFGEVKQLLNRHESDRVAELRATMEEVKEEAAASVEVMAEELEAEKNKSWWQKLRGK